MEEPSDKNGEIKKLYQEEEEESKKPSISERLKLFVIKNFLMVSLIIFVIFGILVPQPGHALNHQISKYICVIYIFLCSGLYLRTKEMKEALMAYKAVIWGIISILAVTSIIGGQLTKLLIPKSDKISNSSCISNCSINGEEDLLGPIELRYGLVLYSIMPCTISSGIVLVNQLDGHFALAVLLTVTTNILSVVTIPLYAKWMLGTESDVTFDIPSLLLKLSLTVLLPIIVGKSLSVIQKLRKCYEKPNCKLILKSISSLCLVFIIWFKVSTTSFNGNLKSLSALSIVFVIGWGMALHILFIIINGLVSWVLRLEKQCFKCVLILASQKTMALAVTVMAFLPKELGDIGLIALSIIIAHISILLFDSFAIAAWLHWEQKQKKTKSVS